MKKKNKNVIRLIAVSLILFLAASIGEVAGVFSFLEHKSYDRRLAIRSAFSTPSEDIALVILDQESLDWAKEHYGWSWPWPRSAYGDMLNFFNKANAAAVGFDVIYSEPSIYGEDDDKIFAQVCRNFGRSIFAVHFEDDTEESSEETHKAVLPTKNILPSVGLLANVRSSIDDDDIVRRAQLYFDNNGKYMPTLGVAPLLMERQYSENIALTNDAVIDLINEYEIPVLDDGSLYLQFRPSIDEFIPYNARQILESMEAIEKGAEPLLDPEMFDGSYIFFGFYAPGLFDIVATPMSKVYPGVGVHITLLDTILGGNFIQKTPLSVSLMFIFVMAIAGAAIIFSREKRRSHKTGIIISIVAVVLVPILAVAFAVVVFIYGYYLPLATPLLAFIASFAVSLFLSYNTEGKQRRYIKNAFKHYLSPVVIEELINNPDQLKLGGERKEISIYFSDVQGFTGISEKLAPEELTALLNDYLSEMSSIILESGGTIDKYEGDAIIAFWNAPTPIPGHAGAALEAAIRCQERLAELRDEYTRRVGMPLHMRIGLNTGAAVVGNMGSHTRFDYTMLGDAVNLAARLEGLNKQFGTYTMCTEVSKNAAEAQGANLAFRELAQVTVVGKETAIRVFEPMRKETYAARQKELAVFQEGLSHFYTGDLKHAFFCFEQIKDRDPAAQKYLERYSHLLGQELPEWDGIWRATSK